MKKKELMAGMLSIWLLTGCSGSTNLVALTTPQNVKHAEITVGPMFDHVDAQILETLQSDTENTIISPLSYHYAMGMLADGLDGESLKEIEAVYGKDKNQLIQRLMMAADAYDQTDHITMSNSLWAQEGSELNRESLQTISDHFRASTFELELPNQCDQITAFIKEQTKGKIEPKIEADKNTVLMLVNTLAVEGTWVQQFTKDEQQFHGSDDITANFLHAAMETPDYTETKAAQIIDIYMSEGGRLRLALPKQSNASLDQSALLDIITMKLTPQELTKVHLSFPEFSIKQHYDLIDLTASLGIEGIFKNPQDFHLLGDKLSVTNIIQDAMMEVNEFGLSAAASTVVGIDKMMLAPEGIEWKEIDMNVNRPFYYFVMDDQDYVMFMGQVHNPKQ